MKIKTAAAILLAAGTLVAAPAIAQTTPTQSAPSVTNQKTDGGDSPTNGQTDQSSAAWHKQHTDGGDSPADPRQTDETAAAWHKQHTQSYSHEDGSPAGVMKQN